MSINSWIKDLGKKYLSRNHCENKLLSELTNDWKCSLSNFSEKLENLAVSTEQEFLDIGEKLQGFYVQSKKMTEMSTQVVGLMSGDEMINSIEGLTHILNDLNQHIETSESNFGNILDILQNYLGTFKKVSSSLDEFKMIVLNLSMLGFFTRVENAHIFSNDTGFSSLTNDVKTLSGNIKDKSSQIKVKSEELSALIQHTLSDVAEFKKSQSNHAKLMLENTVSNHSVLTKKHETASESALNIADKSKEITDQIGDIVTSLQFHDITRQQISHVKEVLDNLFEDITNESKSDKAGTMVHLISLQTAQLHQTKDALINAILKIKQSLQAITQGIQGIVNDTQKIAWASDVEGLSFMENIDAGISSVIDCLDENVNEQNQLNCTMTSVSDMVTKMSVFVKEIENLGLNLQLIALNARIKAAHMGHEGAALDTLSGSIYTLSKESRQNTINLSNILSEVVDTAQSFDTKLKDLQENQKINVKNMMQNLNGLIHALHKINDKVLSVLTEMNMLGESLLKDLESAANEIIIHDEAANVLDEILEEIENIICSAKQIKQEEMSSQEINLADLNNHYTMKSERDVHESFIKRNAGAFMPATPEGMEDDTDSNIEFF